MISSPVLMIPSSAGVIPYVVKSGDAYVVRTVVVSGELVFRFFQTDATVLASWGDIVVGIDVFVSEPLYCYSQDFKDLRFVVSHSHNGIVQGSFGDEQDYGERGIDKAVGIHFSGLEEGYVSLEPDVVAFERRLESASFFKIASLNVADLQVSDVSEGGRLYYAPFKRLEVSAGTLRSLSSMESLSGCSKSLLRYAKGGFVYNGRLSLWGVKYRQFINHHANAALPYTGWNDFVAVPDGRGGVKVDYQRRREVLIASHTLRVYYKEQGKTYITEQKFCYPEEGVRYYYTPVSGAFLAEVYRVDEEGDIVVYQRFNLRRHPNLSGAYYFKGLHHVEGGMVGLENLSALPSLLELNMDTHVGQVFNSASFNPFSFEDDSVLHIPSGVVIGMSVARVAMSSGQFGMYPLYVFSSEGVFSVEVNAQGKYVRVVGISAERCFNPMAILGVNGGVVYVSNRGVMLVSGAQAICLSETIEKDLSARVTTIPAVAELLSVARSLSVDEVADNISSSSLHRLLQSCRSHYDIVEQSLYLMPASGATMAYVYNFGSKSWSTASVYADGVVGEYIQRGGQFYLSGLQHSSAQSQKKTLPTGEFSLFSSKEELMQHRASLPVSNGEVITRPLKLGYPDIMKTIHRVSQRGTFREGSISQCLYGSNDLFHWYAIGSSRGHVLSGLRGNCFRYFRLLVLTHMRPDEHLYGCSIEFDLRGGEVWSKKV